MRQLRVARGHLRQVPLDLHSPELLSQLGHSSTHLHLSSGLRHQKLRTAGLRRYSVRHSLLPYLKGMVVKETPQDLGAINLATTAIKCVIGPKNAPTLRRMAIRIRTIRDRQTRGHVLDTCTIPLLRKCLLEKLSRLVCFSSISIPLLFYFIRELLIPL